MVGFPPEFKQVTKTGDTVILEFESPRPDGVHQVLGSADLKGWQAVSSVVFTPLGGTRMRATVSGATAAAQFYRVAVNNGP